MITIWKYDIPLDKYLLTLSMPESAEVLTIKCQHGQSRMWVKVDTESPMRNYTFRICGSGHDLDDMDNYTSEYVTTWNVHGDDLIFHAFHLIDYELLGPLSGEDASKAITSS